MPDTPQPTDPPYQLRRSKRSFTKAEVPFVRGIRAAISAVTVPWNPPPLRPAPVHAQASTEGAQLGVHAHASLPPSVPSSGFEARAGLGTRRLRHSDQLPREMLSIGLSRGNQARPRP